ncbi:MAG: hypothetical protein KF706_11115 [Chitinophagales bacterium]|nr:hypothetical protein [Chitinophagales bacterium]
MNNINSDRALLAIAAIKLDVRLFLGYDLNEELPLQFQLHQEQDSNKHVLRVF